ncbi:MAG: hypothetical protein AB7V18_18565 [Pyrinomonadaceae bacterium]
MKFTSAFVSILLFVSIITAQRSTPTLIDEFGNVPCEDWVGRLDLFLALLYNQPNSTGVIVLYEGKYWSYEKDALVWPVFGEVHLRANLIRSHFDYRGLQGNRRVLFLTGGFRDEHHVELWLVPLGAALPKPKPTREATSYRRGKATTIYQSCP